MEKDSSKKVVEEDNKIKDSKSDNKKELTVEEKLKETEEKLLRALAETENQRRRFEKEIKDALIFGGFNFAKETLSILDNLQRAKISIKNDVSLKDSKDLNKFMENINIIEKDLISVFQKNKIKKIECMNKKFDPNLHQAMLEIEDDKAEAGTIVQEIQAGYMFEDRLLRPTFVAISKKKSNENPKKDENN